MQKIVPCLWFNNNTEEAINFYISAFSKLSNVGDSQIISIDRYPDPVPLDFMKGMEGKVITAIFEVAGFRFMALDGGPQFNITPAISFFINCHSASELDTLWETLLEGGTALMPLGSYPFSEKYGWLQDKFGVSWQLILEEAPTEQTIVPSLMFVGEQAGNAEEAINLYADLLNNAKVGDIMRYGAEQAPDEEGTVMFAEFFLENQKFTAMDSAQEHNFNFTEAVSFYVECADQAEVNRLWDTLTAVPESEQCGWLKDKYGVSWQIIPIQLGQLMSDPDPVKSRQVMDAMLQMKKIDVAQLQAAYDA